MFDEQNYSGALEMFRSIADSAKIHFNIGLILGRKGDHDGAIEAYDQALKLDQYLVVAFFQRGVAKMIQQHNPEAMDDFNNALKFLRDNEFIDYTQLGLDYKVYRCEVLYNRALCYFCLGQEREARNDLFDASKRTAEERHSWIRRAADSSGMDCPLYCVPKGVVYRPSASKLKSTKKIDFLGSAKVIASADGKDNFTGFKGALVRKETLKSAGGSGSPLSASIQHQKSMRVRRSTPPPEANAALARSNTMPANRQDSSIQPMSAMAPSSRMGSSSLQRETASREPGSLPAHSAMRARMAGTGFAETPTVEVQVSESEDQGDDSEEVSSAFTSPATDATTPSTGGLGDFSPAGPPKSAMKKAGTVDPLDIIRAGLARRTTLKNQNQQAGRAEGKPAMPQRSVTMKVASSRDDDDEEEDRHYSDMRRAESASPRPAASGAAHVARTEMIVPMIQRSNTEGGVQAISTVDYAAGLQTSPDYYGNPEQSSYGSRYVPPQHPGLKHAMNPIMMTPPLSHEEAIARGLAAMRVQNSHVVPPMASTQSYVTHQYDSSAATSPSPSMHSPAPQGTAHYAAMSGSLMSAVRRAPTKKDAMKVKVHYGDDIINLMIPKLASYDSLRAKLAAKLSSAHSVATTAALRIRYLDEDGEAVLMTDEDDYELAKAYAGGDMSTPESNVVERLELWCSV
ncbi:hypothetical protein GGI20_003923 [Coemansia sp. BCRC 34301]|nr:hypothetical protein GGI20_003923 [Coemansia sp. BCRC 34301]